MKIKVMDGNERPIKMESELWVELADYTRAEYQREER